VPANHFALIIASSEYDDARLRRLRSPAADASELGEVLRDPRVGDYQINSLLNSLSHRANEAIEDFFQDRSRDDQLLLYFSCHGIKDDRGRLYFAASNTKVTRLASTGISSEFVAEQMYGCAARRIILLLDCCYSGAFKRGFRHRADKSVDLDNLAGRGRAILYASNAMEYAFEIDSSEIEGSGISSLFTRTIVHALRTGEADLDGDGAVSVDELYAYVSDQLRGITPRQTPGKLIDTEGTIFIARSMKAITGLGTLSKDIRTALSSPLAGVRKGIVEELTPLLDSDREIERLAARAALVQLSNDENDRVATAAAVALEVKPALEDANVDTADRAFDERATRTQQSQVSSAHETSGQAADYQTPAQGSSPDVMARWVEEKQFNTTRLRPGYDEMQVDRFLDEVRDTFLGQRKPPLTAYDVRKIQFSTTRLRPGYDEEQVDAFLDEIELILASRAAPASDEAAGPPPDVDEVAAHPFLDAT
jgi:DivIVA domain-containing protein